MTRSSSIVRAVAAGALTVAVLVALPGGARAADDAPHLERERSPVWQHVERLAEEYREPWYVGAGDLLSGGLLLWAGSRRMIRHYRTGSPSAGSFDFPWFGLFFTLTGSSSVASGIHRTVTPSPEADHARRLLEAKLPERAGMLYLRHRAQSARRDRVRRGVTRLASSLGGAAYVLLLPTESKRQRTENLVTGIATAAVGSAVGIYWLASKSLEEKLWERVRSSARGSRPGPNFRPALTVGLGRHGRDGPASPRWAAGLELHW